MQASSPIRFAAGMAAILILALFGASAAHAQAALCVKPKANGKLKGPVIFRLNECKKNEVEIDLAALVDVSAVQTQIDDLSRQLARLDALEREVARIDGLADDVADVERRTGFIDVVEGDLEQLPGPHVVIEGANLHVRSGSGSTDDGFAGGASTTGLGNVVIGYNELADDADADDRQGAHNLVLGTRNAFSSFGGIVAGADNDISGVQATITGGRFGTASGKFSHISAGGGDSSNLFNEATGEYASITAGFRNRAVGNQSAVSGGSNHLATGFLTSVTGGTNNEAVGAGATASGGAGNMALGANSAISGGQLNIANGVSTSIYGGLEEATTENFTFAPVQAP